MTSTATLAARLAYIIQHGNAWEKAVAQGVHDHAALGTPSEQTPSPPLLSVGSRVQGQPLPGGAPLPDLRTMLRLAHALGHAIADGLAEHDERMAASAAATERMADPLSTAAQALIDATPDLARELAKQPRPAGSPLARWFDAARTYLEAHRQAEADGG